MNSFLLTAVGLLLYLSFISCQDYDDLEPEEDYDEMFEQKMIPANVRLVPPKMSVIEGDIMVREGEIDDYAAVKSIKSLWVEGRVPLRYDPSLKPAESKIRDLDDNVIIIFSS